MEMAKQERARFDIRMSKEQKQFLEKAALLGGYRNLTDFVLFTMQQKAKEIIEEREKTIASERDSAIFFDAITHPNSPSEELIAATKHYNSKLAK